MPFLLVYAVMYCILCSSSLGDPTPTPQLDAVERIAGEVVEGAFDQCCTGALIAINGDPH